MTTLVSFLGIGRRDPASGEYRYETVRYAAPDDPARQVETCFVAQAIAELEDVRQMHVLATEKSWQLHGASLRQSIGNACQLQHHIIPDGTSTAELRQQFRVLREVLQQAGKDEELLLDITHGFRTQPFFAASVLSVLQASGDLPRRTRILYGAFEAGKKTEDEELREVPIWDLSLFLQQQQLAFAMAIFLRTGHAEALSQALEEERRQLTERAKQKERDFPRSHRLLKALKAFADDLSTLRLPQLMRGVGKEKSSATMLLKAVEEYREELCNRDHPALLPLLDDLRDMAEGLTIASFASPDRPKAMRKLTELYLRFHRYLEAAAVAREEIVNHMATGDAIEPAHPQFDFAARRKAENRTTEEQYIRNKLDVRNDLLHCAMRKNPIPADKIMQQVRELVSFSAAMTTPPPRTIFVTRHRGAREWAERQGIVVDDVVEHLDPERINPGDLVIGTLPVHLVAQICRRGGRYKHLSMDIPPDHRGQELSADDMQAFGARLEEFRVESISTAKQKEAGG